MEHLSIKWVGKVLLFAAAILLLLAIGIVWKPFSLVNKSSSFAATLPVAVKVFADQCQQGQGDVIELDKCEHGWAVYSKNQSPKVFDESGNVLCEAKSINDSTATECLRQVSDAVGRCLVECSQSNLK